MLYFVRMNITHTVTIIFSLFSFGLALPVQAERGRDAIGNVTVTVLHATNEEPRPLGSVTKELDEGTAEKLRKESRLTFTHYRVVGSDQKPLFRSYENWAQPFHQSDEVLLRFEAQARPSKEVTRLDMELWLSRKKILKTGAALSADKPLYILGPAWRGGYMILIVSLIPNASPIPYVKP